ncbi:YggT family protein [Natronocella acetinitrilica]|jgi:YggT family protein|uniref:YggT family protein n=1 Tax=Natronocella acetinitrilica TaxID=414046 RepID=A0AAE3G3J7_9GAMM|nr:YggT family protein [Natronocella acetinitrilica]MCP1675151.1 YggT family protein [Natronocella acetinitrilica]
MTGNYLGDPMAFLINTLVGLYILAIMLRFLLQWFRADFYNPISQVLVKITHPVLRPMRRVIPSAGRIDTASIVLMVLLQFAALWLVFSIQGRVPGAGALLALSAWELVNLLLNVFLFATIIRIVLSWVNPGAHHPAISILDSLTDPLLTPLRRVIPSAGGLDFSPMIVIFGIMFLKMLLRPIFLDVARMMA